MWTGTGPSLYNAAVADWAGEWRRQAGTTRAVLKPHRAGLVQFARMKRFLAACLVAAVAMAAAAAAQGRRAISLVVSGGTVITENTAHQVLTPGSVAIDGA